MRTNLGIHFRREKEYGGAIVNHEDPDIHRNIDYFILKILDPPPCSYLSLTQLLASAILIVSLYRKPLGGDVIGPLGGDVIGESGASRRGTLLLVVDARGPPDKPFHAVGMLGNMYDGVTRQGSRPSRRRTDLRHLARRFWNQTCSNKL